MSDNTPNSLEPAKKVNVARMSRWPIYAVLIVGLFLLSILVYSVNFAHNQEEELTVTPKVDIKEEERPLLMGEGRGLALAPPAGSPAIAGPEPKTADTGKREPLIVVQAQKEQPDQYRQELESLRRMKAQAQLTALFMCPVLEPESDTFSSTTVVFPVMSESVLAVSMVFGA